MKKLLYIILPTVAITYCYGLYSFFYLNFNPVAWGEEGRFIFSMLSSIMAVISILIASSKQK